MSREASLLRGLIVMGICVPLALFLGYQLAVPGRLSSLWIGLVLGALFVPLLLRWHHPLLIVAWNLQILAFVLPGKPRIMFLIAAISLFITIVARALRKQEAWIHCPSVSIPLIIIGLVTVFTMEQRGGISGRVFGTESWGVSRYLGVLGAIIGYFALISQRVTPQKAKLMSSLFILSGLTAMLPDLIFLAGPPFYFMLSFFPMGYTTYHAYYLTGVEEVQRFAGIGQAMAYLSWFLLLRYGIRGMFDWHHPWRLAVFVGVFLLSMIGGFRGAVVFLAILFIVQAYLERVHRSRLVFVFLGGGMVVATLLVGFADRLPLVMQRSLSFLPIKVDPTARQEAENTIDWRLQMWRIVAPEVPKYLFLGKGYAFDSTDLYLSNIGRERGFSPAYEQAMITSDYHNGILTLIIPLGIYGFVAFLAFCWGALRALYANFRYGDPELKQINTFLLALFATKVFWYFVPYGEFYLDLMTFTGIIGLSLTLNGGVRKKALAAVPEPTVPEPASLQSMQPAYRIH